MKKVVGIVQARCGSNRFPDKIFADISGYPLIWHVINRLKHAKTLDQIVLATTLSPSDDKLYGWALDNNLEVYRGSETNVLNRFLKAAEFVGADVIVRITADDPLKEPTIIDEAVIKFFEGDIDLVTNNYPPTYPEGLDVEVFSRNALNRAEKESSNPFEHEHVTQYFYRNPKLFKIYNITNNFDLSYLRWTVDFDVDLEMIRKIYALLFKNAQEIFSLSDVLSVLQKYPEISHINSEAVRSEMYKNK